MPAYVQCMMRKQTRPLISRPKRGINVSTQIQKDRSDQVLLPRQRAFVLQFRTQADLSRQHYVGRVEHVASGRATRFRSLDELLAFLAQVLSSLPPQLNEDP